MDNIKAEQLRKLKFPNKKVIISGIIGALLFILSIVTVIGPIIVAIITAIYIFMQKKAIDKGRNAVIQQIENERSNYLQILNGFLAEVVDFRRLYSEKDKNSQKVIDLLNELTPEQYITVQNSNKVRQVL